jgi:hypothetical protein
MISESRPAIDWSGFPEIAKDSIAFGSPINGGSCFPWRSGDADDVEIVDYH